MLILKSCCKLQDIHFHASKQLKLYQKHIICKMPFFFCEFHAFFLLFFIFLMSPFEKNVNYNNFFNQIY